MIAGLRLPTRIGVPEEERLLPQCVEAHIRMTPAGSLAGLSDDISRTIDYHSVAQRVRALAASGERRLLETLAEDIAVLLLDGFPLRTVTVEIRKFILADTDHVAVSVTLHARNQGS